MNATYLTVAGRIRRELQELTQVVERTQRIWQEGSAASNRTGEGYYMDAVALNLHGFYAGIERLLEMIKQAAAAAKQTWGMCSKPSPKRMSAGTHRACIKPSNLLC